MGENSSLAEVHEAARSLTGVMVRNGVESVHVTRLPPTSEFFRVTVSYLTPVSLPPPTPIACDCEGCQAKQEAQEASEGEEPCTCEACANELPEAPAGAVH